jgi:hypothetical protein
MLVYHTFQLRRTEGMTYADNVVWRVKAGGVILTGGWLRVPKMLLVNSGEIAQFTHLGFRPFCTFPYIV